MAHNETLFRFVREALADQYIGDLLEDVGTAVGSYIQQHEEEHDLREIVDEARRALPAAHDIVGALIAAQAGRD